jgi:hypothetical protein
MNKPAPRIMKIQRPITTNDPKERWLFYTRDRTTNMQVPPSHSERKAMGDDFKMYAEYDAYSGRFIKRIEDQDW